MHPEHVKLCGEYKVERDEANDVPAYMVLVERLNAENASLRVALSAANMRNHYLQDMVERGELL